VHLRTYSLAEHPQIDPVAIGIRSGILWVGEEMRIAGVGERTRLSVARPDGAATAQTELRNTDHQIDDEVAGPGAGPVGLGAFPFDRELPGELVLPRIVVGQMGERRWLTIDVDQTDLSAAVGEIEAISAAPVAACPVGERTVESVLSPETWRDDVVGETVRRIKQGNFSKAVMAREFRVHATQTIDTTVVLDRLLERFPTANIFAVDGFLGATPELLVGRLGRTVRAHPLAGTAPHADDPKVDAALVAELLASTKNQHEHRITIDWLLNNLLPFCSFVDAEPEPGIMSLANVHHLATRVEGQLSQPAASILDLVAALHPTPAVGGDPQAVALQVIAELEGADRGRYAGPVGWVDAQGNGEFGVGIRSAQVEGSVATMFAGVGVVAASDPASELAETEAKAQALLWALGVNE
jgi:menaquinone-specific isochorismate synthase